MNFNHSQRCQLALQSLQNHKSNLEKEVSECSLKLQQQIKQEQLLSATVLRILHSLNPEPVLNDTVADVRKLLGTERVLIYRFQSDWSGSAIAESVNDDLPSLLGRRIYDHCFADNWVEAYRNGRIQVISDIYAEGLSCCHVEMLASFRIRANLVIPILLKSREILEPSISENQQSRLWGLLVAQHCSAPWQWQASEIKFLEKLATEIALAIQQTELYQQLQAELVERQRAETKVHQLNSQLEQRVVKRTAELEAMNLLLRKEIATRIEVEQRLFQEKELAQITLKSIGDGVITTDSLGRIKYLNPIAAKLTGWKNGEAKGLPSTKVFKIINEFTRQPVKSPIERALNLGEIVSLENHTVLIAHDGTEFPIEDSAAPIRDHNGEIIGAVLVFHDVSESRQLERKLSWQANHDALTGLRNRYSFEQLLRETIENAKINHQNHVLCYLDLDQFKVINDACGHIAGDELLRQVTALLQEQVRSKDHLARLGGDEFGLLLNQCSLFQAQKIAQSLRELIQSFHFTWQRKTFPLGVSIGLVAINANTQNLTKVLSAADVACYVAKDRGRNCIHVYQANDRELAKQHSERQWISRIHRALAENSFRLYSQKIVPSNADSTTQHYEVLLRLLDENGKIILPMAFIPAAERYDLMPLIDQWVVQTFLATYAQYSQSHLINHPHLHKNIYTINLSGATINNNQFLDFFQEILVQYQVPTESLCFEITETVAIANLNQAVQLIKSLKRLGCSIALDDFGSGMSSLTYLKNLPVDYLKIDGSFVKNIVSNQVDYATVDYFNRISHMMGIQTIAEFVENDVILNKLQQIGIDYAQGYGIEMPSRLSFRYLSG